MSAARMLRGSVPEGGVVNANAQACGSQPWMRTREAAARRASVRRHWALVIAAAAACTKPPLAHAPAERGVLMGRVQIFSDGREVTQDCTLDLSGAGMQKLEVRPDASGWVFASMPPGGAAISTVNYAGRSHATGLDFHVAGDGRTTYFGHVRLDLQFRPATWGSQSSYAQQAVGDGMRAGGDSIANMPQLPLGAAVGAAAAITVVGVVAMGLLADTDMVGTTKAEVDDKTYEAIAAYSARYRKPPKDPVVSLAGSTFSSDPSLSPSVQKHGEVVYTEASLGGVRLTWLAIASHEHRKAALRVQRFLRKDAPCANVKLTLDGRERVVPTTSKTVRASAAFKQTVQGELDLRAVRDVASAKHVVLDVCGTARAFSALARGATINFANAYQELLTSASAPPVASPPVTDATARAPEAARPAAGATAAVPPVAADGEAAPSVPDKR
jgi:hypothetical protein